MTAFNKAWLILKSNYDPKRAVASSSGTEGRNYGENTELDICPKCKGPKAIGNETCWKCSEDYSLHQFYSEPLPYVAKGQPFSAEGKEGTYTGGQTWKFGRDVYPERAPSANYERDRQAHNRLQGRESSGEHYLGGWDKYGKPIGPVSRSLGGPGTLFEDRLTDPDRYHTRKFRSWDTHEPTGELSDYGRGKKRSPNSHRPERIGEGSWTDTSGWTRMQDPTTRAILERFAARGATSPLHVEQNLGERNRGGHHIYSEPYGIRSRPIAMLPEDKRHLQSWETVNPLGLIGSEPYIQSRYGGRPSWAEPEVQQQRYNSGNRAEWADSLSDFGGHSPGLTHPKTDLGMEGRMMSQAEGWPQIRRRADGSSVADVEPGDEGYRSDLARYRRMGDKDTE